MVDFSPWIPPFLEASSAIKVIRADIFRFSSGEVVRPSLDRAAISLLLLPSVLTLVLKSDGLTFSSLLFVIAIVF